MDKGTRMSNNLPFFKKSNLVIELIGYPFYKKNNVDFLR